MLQEVRTAMMEWRERWRGASGGGYSNSEEALLDTDELLGFLEAARERWQSQTPPSDLAEVHTLVALALDDLTARLRELFVALDEQDAQRMRALSQAVEMSETRLSELAPHFRGGR